MACRHFDPNGLTPADLYGNLTFGTDADGGYTLSMTMLAVFTGRNVDTLSLHVARPRRSTVFLSDAAMGSARSPPR